VGKNDKCYASVGDFEPCRALSRAMEGTASSVKKGIVVWCYSSLKTGKATRSFVGFKGGKYGTGGVAFNYCPFCGADLTPSHESKAEATDDKA